jgi:hypothetical protein
VPDFVELGEWNILCGIGVRFNFICDEMLGGVSDELALRTGRGLQAFNRRKPLLASIMLAAAQRSAMTALRQRFTLRQTRCTVPSMFSIPWCRRANGAAHANRSSRLFRHQT